MILEKLRVSAEEIEQRSGWKVEELQACRGDVCVPITPETCSESLVDASLLAEQLLMPLVHNEQHGIYSLGPEAGGRALSSAVAPPLVRPDLQGGTFDLRSLLGQKVLLVAWASW